jgi:beta-galactosidase
MAWTALSLLSLFVATSMAGSFVIEGDQFVRDGQPFRIISGAFHYFRTPQALWADRLAKMRAGGLNTVETYVPWNLHEPSQGTIVFDGNLDIVSFIRQAQSAGLLVIVRGPPYICAEWEFGGLPAWLQQKEMVVRSNDQRYLRFVEPFLLELLKTLAPLQYSKGGPIIAMQVENEYGNFGNDEAYLQHLVDLFKSSGIDSVLFSSNGNWPATQRNGAVDSVLRTVNFGTGADVTTSMKYLRDAQPKGPLFCSEFWGGWFDIWGDAAHHTTTPAATAATMDQILAAGASVNVYMYTGGTNFGYLNGANYDWDTDVIKPEVTSYDYDAAISEAGDVTPKWSALRDVIGKYATVPTTPPPPAAPKKDYGSVPMAPLALLINETTLPVLSAYSQPVAASSPSALTFAHLRQSYGFILLQTTVLGPLTNAKLTLLGLHDRATVYVDGVFAGTVTRGGTSPSIAISTAKSSAQLSLLIENLGRINYGPGLYMDTKGLTVGAQIDGMLLFNWTAWSLPLPVPPRSTSLPPPPATVPANIPAFYRGTFNIAEDPVDTFLNPKGWGKGVAYINGFNIGRYWPSVGPQVTLYIPKTLLVTGTNEIVFLELHQANPTASFSTVPIL